MSPPPTRILYETQLPFPCLGMKLSNIASNLPHAHRPDHVAAWCKQNGSLMIRVPPPNLPHAHRPDSVAAWHKLDSACRAQCDVTSYTLLVCMHNTAVLG